MGLDKLWLSRYHVSLVVTTRSRTLLIAGVIAIGLYDDACLWSAPGLGIGVISAMFQSAGRVLFCQW